MALLKIPVSISKDGFFERALYEEQLQSRLRIFVLSGASKFMILPTPGISTIWQQLTTIGPSSRFCSKDVFPESERQKLEIIIRKEINSWLEEEDEPIQVVRILGDDRIANGILFKTNEMDYIFSFEFGMPGKGLTRYSIGNWNIKESINVSS